MFLLGVNKLAGTPLVNGTPRKYVASLNGLPEKLIDELRQWWVNQGPPPRAQEILEAWGFAISHTKLIRWCDHAWPELQVQDENCLEDPNASYEENARRLLARKVLLVSRQINIDNKYAPEALSSTADALRKVTSAALQIEKAEAERARTEEFKKELREEVRQEFETQLRVEIHEPPDLFDLMEYGSIAAYLAAKAQKRPEQQPMQTEGGEPLQ